jgi:hypothetical protein
MLMLMDPNNSGFNQYDFIMNHGQKQPRNFMPTGNSKKQRIILVSLLIAVVLVGFIVLSLFLASSSKGKTEPILAIARQQQEIIRVSSVGVTNARSSATAALAMNTALSTNTAQQQSVTYLAKNGRKTNTKALSSLKNAQTDTALTSAMQNGEFDKVFTDTIDKLITDYQAAIKKEYNSSKSQSEKALLKPQYDGSVLLLDQAKMSS